MPLMICLALTAITSLNYAEAANAGEAHSLPRAARALLPRVIKEARIRQLDPAIMAGQIHQESGWDSSAASSRAMGLAQFTPETAAWMRATYPAELDAGAGASSPAWAIRAMCLYDRWLMDRVDQEPRNDNGAAKPAEPAPHNPWRESPSRGQNYPAALRAYNGGLGWVLKERICNLPSLPVTAGISLLAAAGVAAPSAADFDCCRRFRSAASCKENLEYPARILNIHAPMYRTIINPFGGRGGMQEAAMEFTESAAHYPPRKSAVAGGKS